MPNYHVNRNAQWDSGDHEVHVDGCARQPALENRVPLGWHNDCHGAVAAAKRIHSDTNGCARCCPDCHTT